MPPAIAEENVTLVVKWFNPTKGFGFVNNPERGPDIFLHASVVASAGGPELPEGAIIVADLMETQRGLQVATIHSVDLTSAKPGRPPHPKSAPGADGEAIDEGPGEGRVKFFDAGKGFGFVALDRGGPDVFVSSRTLERCGLMSVENEQRVRVHTRMGAKGLMAESIEVV